MTTGEVRFGLIGYGAWGRHHAAAIAKSGGAHLAAIAAPSDDSRAAAAADHDRATVYADYHELLAESEIDVVAIVVPSHLHFEVTSAALLAGKHVLLEKPMALRLEQCDELMRLAGERQRLLAVGHELRLSSLWGEVKKLVESGSIGLPQYALVELWRMPYRHGSGGWRYDVDRVGNWILEEPIHFFDLARWYLARAGEPQAIFARANSRQPGHPELHDNFSAIVDFSGGAYAVISQTLSAYEHHQVVKVCGTSGAIWASWSGAMDRTLHPTFWLKHFDGEQIHDVRLDKITGEMFELEDQVAMMVEAVAHQKPLVTDGRDGRWSVAMCLAAQRSVETGQRVSMSEFT